MQNRNTDSHNAQDDDFLRPLQGMRRAAPASDLFATIEQRLDEQKAAPAPSFRLRWDLVAAACLLIVNVYLFNRSPQAQMNFADGDAPPRRHDHASTTPYEQIQLTSDFTLYE